MTALGAVVVGLCSAALVLALWRWVTYTPLTAIERRAVLGILALSMASHATGIGWPG